MQEPQCAEPSFAPVGGEVDAGTGVALSAPNLPQGGVIAYTTDGTAPTESSAAYSAPIQVHQNETLRAIAFAPGACSDSPIAAATYVTTPFAGPPQISGVSPQTVVAGGEMIISGSNLAAASGDTTDVTVALFPAGDAGSPIPLSIASGSAGQLVVNTPADAYELAPGTVNVTVSTPDGVASSQVTVIPVASTCGAACPDGSGCQYTIAPVYGEGQTCTAVCAGGFITSITVTYAYNCVPTMCPAAAMSAGGCVGSSTCALQVDNSICGVDPCVGTAKGAIIDIGCGQPAPGALLDAAAE